MTTHPHLLPFDELDYQIIQLLNQDARHSASEIARIAGANERTIRNRIDRLVELGALRLTAVVDPNAFGYQTSVDIFLQVDLEREAEIVDCLLRMPEICYLAYGQGTNEMSIEARFKSNAEMYDFLKRTLPAITGLSVTSYALVPRILRNIDQWLPRSEDFGLPSQERQGCQD
jgi:Lrp/AsnC family transcriptional regulator, regulator for asnA, asnC and gidA